MSESETDAELLRAYAETGSNAAFTALVDRHLNLVFSVARRHVRSPSAEDVAQSVFIELARHARRIKPGMPLVAWLHVVSRRHAINALRSETRRQAREFAALEIEAMKPPSSLWTELEPLLDTALEKLSDADRTAVLLRFFENKSMREVGAALGASEEAAQRRVGRAVERLRSLFAKGGVAVGVESLISELSAHAIVSAPSTLGASISAANVSISATLLQTSKAIVMTTTQKSLIAAGVIVALGGGFYEAQALARQNQEIFARRQQLATLDHEAENLRQRQQTAERKTAEIDRQVDAALAQASAAPSATDAAMEKEMKAWLERLDRLQTLRQERPDLLIPELTLLDKNAWFQAAKTAKFESETEIRDTFAALRRQAENSFATQLGHALAEFLRANSKVPPTDPAQLLPFFDSPIDPQLLARYEIIPEPDRGRNSPFFLATKTVVDLDRDSFWRIGPNSFGTQNAGGYNIAQARRRFAAEHPGQKPTDAAQLAPYLKWPVEPDALQKAISTMGQASP